MIIIGINPSHNSTAALLKDGKIIGCISEERLTGYKNETGNPVLSIKYLLKQFDLKATDIDYLAISMRNPTAYIHYRDDKGGHSKKSFLINLTLFFHIMVRPIIDNLMLMFPSFGKIYQSLYGLTYQPIIWNMLKRSVYKEFESIGFARDKVIFIDHHEAHAASGYFNMPNREKGDVLVFSADGEGDGLCASVSIINERKWKYLAKTPTGNSPAQLYAGVTQYLGMKMNDHEYKVMGLAAYAKEEDINLVYERLKDLISVNEKKLTFESLFHSYTYIQNKFLNKLLLGIRFDLVAGGLQKVVEEVVLKWIEISIKKTGIKRVAFGGGLFLNIKLNKRILEIEEIKEAFFMPSAGDESTAIGASQALYYRLKKKNIDLPEIERISNLYFGPEFDDKEIKKELSKLSKSKYKIKKSEKIEIDIVDILVKGYAVANFSGKMEFGARALGNRSILADPSNIRIIQTINDQIKSRDFWMPFACTILQERERDYIVNPKKTEASYMILAFESTQLARKDLIAGMHQYDFTVRPQILKKEHNPRYYKLIKEFEKRTGIGGVLNTSFNLHGFPIVCTPKDAIYVFSNSGLKYLAIGNYIVSKTS